MPQFVDGTDQLFIAFGGGTTGRTGSLRWFEAGSGLPERALDLPATDDVIADQPIDVSSNAEVMLTTAATGFGSRLDAVVAAVRLDPQAWQDKLCDLIGGRAFTGEQVANLFGGQEPDPCPPETAG